jgi:hypothetical protein
MSNEWIRRPILLIACVGMLIAGVWFAIRPTEAPAAFTGPTPQELDSLRRYLEPVPPAPEPDDYQMYLPALDGPRALSRAAPPSSYPSRRVSAILFAGGQPLAIVDDQQVREGSPLSAGARVVSIQRDHVIVREADGTQRTLRVAGNS